MGVIVSVAVTILEDTLFQCYLVATFPSSVLFLSGNPSSVSTLQSPMRTLSIPRPSRSSDFISFFAEVFEIKIGFFLCSLAGRASLLVFSCLTYDIYDPGSGDDADTAG